MGLVQDLSDLIKAGPRVAAGLNSMKVNTKSIASNAKDSTFQFPCIIADSSPVDMSNTTVKYLEHLYAAWVQQVISMHPYMDVTLDPSPVSYLKKFHQNNFKFESAFDDLEVDDEDMSRYMESVYNGSYKLYMNKTGSFGVLFNEADTGVSSLMDSNRALLKEHMSDFDLTPVDVFSEADNIPNEYDMANQIIQNEINARRDADRLNTLKISGSGKAPQLLDRDVKKSNDMVPYGIQIRLIAVNDKKELIQYLDIVIGIKAIMHPVHSDDMINNIVKAFQNKSLSFKLLRWTSGEISFVKDILLNITDMKEEAIDRANGKKPFMGLLKRLKARKLSFRNGTVPTGVLPCCTFIITAYEADYLENKFGIDVRKDKIAKKLMQSAFLMAFVILDEGSGIISFISDADDSFQTYSLESLERTNSLNSNTLGREIGRMISR